MRAGLTLGVGCGIIVVDWKSTYQVLCSPLNSRGALRREITSCREVPLARVRARPYLYFRHAHESEQHEEREGEK